MRSSRREHQAVRRGGPGVVTRYRARRGRGWTTRKSRSSGPPEDRARGDQGIIGWTRSAHSSDDGGSRVIIRWAWSAHSSDGGGGTRIHTMDIEGARRRSHEPTAVRPELGLGWTGSKAETRSGPGRAGPRSKMYRWRLVTF